MNFFLSSPFPHLRRCHRQLCACRLPSDTIRLRYTATAPPPLAAAVARCGSTHSSQAGFDLLKSKLPS